MPASIFQGPTVKILKDALQFFGGSKITYNGSVNPSVSATVGLPGDIYVQSGSAAIWVKQDSGSTTNWTNIATVSGDVVGPASATDNAIARFDGTTGKIIQNSGASIDDSGNITATNLSGTNTGNVTVTDTSTIDLSLTGQALTADVINASITNAKLATMPTNTIKGNNTGGTAAPVDLTGTQTTALLDVFTTSLKGLAPASGGGTTNFLRADGTWAAVSASGDVVGPASATDNALARFDTTTGKLIQNSTAILTDTGVLTTSMYVSGSANDSTTGSSQTLATVTTSVVRLTNSGLFSVVGIPAGVSGQILYVHNTTTNQIAFINESGATAANRMVFESGADKQLNQDGTIIFVYDATTQRWRGLASAVSPAPAGLGRALVAGGANGGNLSTINYFQISTLGNGASFGSLTVARYGLASAGSSTRALFAGGDASPATTVIDYVTTATTGNATSFGALLDARYYLYGASNQSRAVFSPGVSSAGAVNTSQIQYTQIATLGNTSAFGSLTPGNRANSAAVASPGRMVIGAGYNGGAGVNNMDYLDFATLSNTTSFGSLGAGIYNLAGASNNTRGLFAGGVTNQSQIYYITIAVPSSSTNFGVLLAGNETLGGTSNSTRAVWSGGTGAGSNVIQYNDFATLANSISFGTLTYSPNSPTSTSDSHGGL